MSEPKFVDGLRVFKPHENVPDFIVANMLIRRDDRNAFLEFIADQPDDDIKIDIKRSKGGKYYTQVNEWKVGQQPGQSPSRPLTPQDQIEAEAGPMPVGDEEDMANIPF